MANPPGLALDLECTRTVACRRFGPLAKALRRGCEMSQEDVEAAGDVGRHTIGDTESRKTHATIENGKRIGHALRVKLWMLLIVIEHGEEAGPDTIPDDPIPPEEFRSLLRRRLREELEALGPEPAGEQVPGEGGRAAGKMDGGIPP
jgi:DNA-binding XRE family transcriptional regulator